MAGSNSPARVTIVFHNYYGGHVTWVKWFCEQITVPFDLCYNMVGDSFFNQEEPQDILNRMRDASIGTPARKIILRRSPNQGKDIGGKLVLLDAVLREKLDSDYHIFLHDKKSPHKVLGQQWQEKLFRIVSPAFVEKALDLFDKDEKLGLVAASDSLQNEYDPSRASFISTNAPLLTELKAAYRLNNDDYRYVAGTMFWARSAPMLRFFRNYPPLQIRSTLEKGNVLDEKAGSRTHSWERLFSWLIFAQGYTLSAI